MKITVGELKRIIREAAGDLQPTTDLQDITTDRERQNGTTTLQDPVTADVYKINTNGYVRRYSPDWELSGGAGKSAQAFQHQNPVIVHRAPSKFKYGPTAPSYASADGLRAGQMAALERSVAKRRADLKGREQFAAKNQAKMHRRDADDGTVRYNW